MKITGDDTRMIEISEGEFVEVRGEAVRAVAVSSSDEELCQPEFERFRGKRVLILELVEPCQ